MTNNKCSNSIIYRNRHSSHKLTHTLSLIYRNFNITVLQTQKDQSKKTKTKTEKIKKKKE